MAENIGEYLKNIFFIKAEPKVIKEQIDLDLVRPPHLSQEALDNEIRNKLQSESGWQRVKELFQYRFNC